MSALEAQRLEKAFKGRNVVKKVDLRVEGGEIVGLLGPNGAGKTTTFNMLVGRTRPDGGRILLEGKDITDLRLYKRARIGIAFLPQHGSLFSSLTVRENITAVLELHGCTGHECGKAAERLLDEFRLTDLAEQRAATLSGGEARRAEIARAVAIGPSYVLLDEPFAGIDPITVGLVQDLIGGLRARGLGVLISDHNVRQTLKICHRAYVMNQGEIVAEGTAQELVGNELVRQVYIGEDFRL